VFITHHGTYIDGFAGPQQECETESWAAKLVLASEPKWMRHFHLCDKSRAQIKRLEALSREQPTHDSAGRKIARDIHVYPGDFNTTVDKILASGNIKESEATFCLLDQRTFQCEWQTVEKLARHKKVGTKIELFYFLANWWFDRALSGVKNFDIIARWWGRDDWKELFPMSRIERRNLIVNRMRTELGYKSVKAWEIFNRRDGGATMYYMIHATDHPEGPPQMSRAYRDTVRSIDNSEQYQLWAEPKEPDSDPGAPAPQAQRTA
jgi:three-Cys-motif partner protein